MWFKRLSLRLKHHTNTWCFSTIDLKVCHKNVENLENIILFAKNISFMLQNFQVIISYITRQNFV